MGAIQPDRRRNAKSHAQTRTDNRTASARLIQPRRRENARGAQYRASMHCASRGVAATLDNLPARAGTPEQESPLSLAGPEWQVRLSVDAGSCTVVYPEEGTCRAKLSRSVGHHQRRARVAATSERRAPDASLTWGGLTGTGAVLERQTLGRSWECCDSRFCDV